MLMKRADLGALAIIGVVAAASGACFGSRQHATESQQTAAHDTVLPAPVTETENSLAPAPPAETAAPTPEPAPAKPARAAAAARPTAPAATASTSRSRNTRETANVRRPATSPSYSPAPAATASSAPANQPASAESPEQVSAERRQPAPEPQKQFEELVIPADSVIGLQVETSVSSEQAKVEDPVKARVTRDVKVRDAVAIPAGSRVEGAVTLVDKGGRLKDQARLGIRFHTVVLADGTRLPINTETIYRDGESPARQSAAKIGGGAVGGAVLGAILGGKKGAVIGTTVGAGAGGAAVMASDPSSAELPAGSTVTVRMSAPATVTVEK